MGADWLSHQVNEKLVKASAGGGGKGMRIVEQSKRSSGWIEAK